VNDYFQNNRDAECWYNEPQSKERRKEKFLEICYFYLVFIYIIFLDKDIYDDNIIVTTGASKVVR
jgi:hypothetical protein